MLVSQKPRMGFTLAEILMVIVILGVLAGIAFPKLYPNKEKAYSAEALEILGALRRAQVGYKLEHNVYYVPSSASLSDTDWNVLGMENPESVNWIYKVTASGAAVAAVRATLTSDPNNYGGTCVLLNVDSGQYSGTHMSVRSLEGATYGGTCP